MIIIIHNNTLPFFRTGGSVVDPFAYGEWGVAGSCRRGVGNWGDKRWEWEAVRLVCDDVSGSLLGTTVATGTAKEKKDKYCSYNTYTCYINVQSYGWK